MPLFTKQTETDEQKFYIRNSREKARSSSADESQAFLRSSSRACTGDPKNGRAASLVAGIKVGIAAPENYCGVQTEIAVRSTTDLPILRKDFIIDPIQIYEAATAGADAVLLIVAALDGGMLGDLRDIAEDQLGLDALVEVHTSEELHRALDAGAKIIGVNNRNLQTFQVSLETSERLIAETEDDKIMISESGLQDAESLRRLDMLGFRGFLIGETLMRATNPEKALRDLIHAASEMAGAQRRGYTSFGLRH